MLGAGLSMRQGPVRSTDSPPPPRLQALAGEIGSWRCEPVGAEEVEYVDPNVDVAWSGACERGEKSRITIYVGYAGGESSKKRLASPRGNYPHGDSHWSYVGGRSVEIPSAVEQNGRLRANQVLLQHTNGQRAAVLYWYQLAHQTFSDEFWYRVVHAVQNLREHRAETTVVRFSIPLRVEESDEAFREERELASVFYPFLIKGAPRS